MDKARNLFDEGLAIARRLIAESDVLVENFRPGVMAKLGLDYAVVDITEEPEARDYVMALGYLQAPVVVAGNEHWSGFRPDRIKALAGVAAVAAVSA